jgi:HK97 gp10 family phage protein
MIPSLKFEGAKELEAGLMELSGVAATAVVRTALTDSLKPVAASAAGRVAHDTGRLERSIGIGTRLTKRQKGLNRPIVSAQGVEAYVGPGVVGGRYDGRHGHLVEFGTVHMRPRPFMRPAWLSNLQAVFNGLASTMGAELAKAAKRAARKALKARR